MSSDQRSLPEPRAVPWLVGLITVPHPGHRSSHTLCGAACTAVRFPRSDSRGKPRGCVPRAPTFKVACGKYSFLQSVIEVRILKCRLFYEGVEAVGSMWNFPLKINPNECLVETEGVGLKNGSSGSLGPLLGWWEEWHHCITWHSVSDACFKTGGSNGGVAQGWTVGRVAQVTASSELRWGLALAPGDPFSLDLSRRPSGFYLIDLWGLPRSSQQEASKLMRARALSQLKLYEWVFWIFFMWSYFIRGEFYIKQEWLMIKNQN